jgi:hypothetical protein
MCAFFHMQTAIGQSCLEHAQAGLTPQFRKIRVTLRSSILALFSSEIVSNIEQVWDVLSWIPTLLLGDKPETVLAGQGFDESTVGGPSILPSASSAHRSHRQMTAAGRDRRRVAGTLFSSRR